METKKIEIEIPAGKKAEWVDGVLTLVDEKDKRPVTERIKTFEDACYELGEEHPHVMAYNDFYEAFGELNKVYKDILAYLKLRIIAAALNEGWKPQFAKDEWRYFPWFCIYTQEEADKIDEERTSRVVYRSVGNANGGVACAYTNRDSSNMNTHVGSRIVFKTKELAEYAGKQFIGIWADYVFRS